MAANVALSVVLIQDGLVPAPQVNAGDVVLQAFNLSTFADVTSVFAPIAPVGGMLVQTSGPASGTQYAIVLIQRAS